MVGVNALLSTAIACLTEFLSLWIRIVSCILNLSLLALGGGPVLVVKHCYCNIFPALLFILKSLCGWSEARLSSFLH
jgi:hypothetical protein